MTLETVVGKSRKRTDKRSEMITEGAEMESDAELLEELRHYGGWYSYFQDLDGFAQRALERGVLRWAYDTAMRRMGAGWSESSLSSGTLVVASQAGLSDDATYSFLVLLRAELQMALADG